MYVILNMKNKQKEWHPATKPLECRGRQSDQRSLPPCKFIVRTFQKETKMVRHQITGSLEYFFLRQISSNLT
jgi:hypothetical protein